MPKDPTQEHTRIKVVPIMTKRCPFCSTVLALSEKQCHSCKRKVGDPNKDGVAKVPGVWKTYASFVVAFVIMVAYFMYAQDIIKAVKAIFG